MDEDDIDQLFKDAYDDYCDAEDESFYLSEQTMLDWADDIAHGDYLIVPLSTVMQLCEDDPDNLSLGNLYIMGTLFFEKLCKYKELRESFMKPWIQKGKDA